MARASFLGSMDKTLVFMDSTFYLKNGKSSYDFFMMKYKNPLAAGAHLGQRIFSSKEADEGHSFCTRGSFK